MSPHYFYSSLLTILPPPRSTLFPYNDALPIYFIPPQPSAVTGYTLERASLCSVTPLKPVPAVLVKRLLRSEEHTSELQSRPHLVCRLLLEKKTLCSRTPASALTSATIPPSLSS